MTNAKTRSLNKQLMGASLLLIPGSRAATAGLRLKAARGRHSTQSLIQFIKLASLPAEGSAAGGRPPLGRPSKDAPMPPRHERLISMMIMIRHWQPVSCRNRARSLMQISEHSSYVRHADYDRRMRPCELGMKRIPFPEHLQVEHY